MGTILLIELETLRYLQQTQSNLERSISQQLPSNHVFFLRRNTAFVQRVSVGACTNHAPMKAKNYMLPSSQ